MQKNTSRKPHVYNVGGRVFIKNDWSAKYRKVAFLGPYPITNVNDNGTVYVRNRSPRHPSQHISKFLPH